MTEDDKAKNDINTAHFHTHGEWVNSNEDHFNSADTSRYNSQKIRNQADLLIADCQGQTHRDEDSVKFKLRERLKLCSSWRSDLQRELDNNKKETGALQEKKKQLEHALHQTERPVKVAMDCLKNREARTEIDLVRDEVERSLDLEVDTIRQQQASMRDLLQKATELIDNNIRKQVQLQEDLDNKDLALNIDKDCFALRNTSNGISLQTGVEEVEASGSEPKSWANFSLKNRQESGAARAESLQLRTQIDEALDTAVAEMMNRWNNTNQAFKERIMETMDAHKQLSTRLNLLVKEMRDQDRHIDKLKAAIRAKGPPMRVAQTRLEKRTHRPDIEACNDPPHNRMIQEVATLNNNMDLLNQKLQEATEAKQDLAINKGRLEKDIAVKQNTLKIDKQKCMGIRGNFPYHMKCDIASKNPAYYYVYYNIV